MVVTVDIQCGNLFIPNAFSPNSDGENDVFYIKANANCVSSCFFIIYDRWGEKVFETTNILTGWDGRYKYRLMNTDVFMYSLDATFISGESIYKTGNVNLVK